MRARVVVVVVVVVVAAVFTSRDRGVCAHRACYPSSSSTSACECRSRASVWR
jgi:hypothetical protein